MTSRNYSLYRAQMACATLVLTGLTMSLNAYAGTLPPDAPATTGGTYTVTLPGCSIGGGPLYCAGQWLEERAEPNGSWQSVNGTFVDKAPGTYSYRTADTYCDAWYGYCYTTYSSPVAVLVLGGDLPLPDPLAAQLRYQYTVSVGNVVGDAATDLLIERSSGPAVGNGVIDAVILQRIGSGFAAVVPNPAQLNSSAWQAAALDVAVEDMNADGYADLAIRNIGAVVPGAKDQLVFASANPYDAKPKGIRAFDDSLSEFTANLIDYMSNERFFAENAGWTVFTSFYSYYYCPLSNAMNAWDGGWSQPCTAISFPAYTVVPDFSDFDPDAVEIWQDEAAVAAGDLPPSQAAERIAQRIEDVIDVRIGGWDMREIFGNGPGIGDAAERRGLEAFLAIIGIGNARADEVEPDAAQTQGPRANDVIHIVSRYIFGSSVNKMHTALLYKMPGTGIPTWFSGFDSDDSALGDGTLVAATNDPKDSPLLMRMTVGEVLPPAPQSRFVYFFTDMQSAHEYYKALPMASQAQYDAIPEIPCGGCNGRNSNGYTNGLILATRGQPSAAPGFVFNGLTGWEYPVEAHYFGR
jgi:hypothetical protein